MNKNIYLSLKEEYPVALGDNFIQNFKVDVYDEAPVQRFLAEMIYSNPESVCLSDFIHLAAEFMALESFSMSMLMCNSHKKYFVNTLTNEVSHLGRSPVLMDGWHHSLITQLRGTLQEIAENTARCGNSVSVKTLDEYGLEIERFENIIGTPFSTLFEIHRIHRDYVDQINSPIMENARMVCVRSFENEHSRAKSWFLRLIGAMGDIRSSELIFKNTNPIAYRSDESLSRARPGLQLTTEVNKSTAESNRSSRYIRLTFSLQSLTLQDFLLLAFKLLHEYFSHLYACLTAPEIDSQEISIDAHTKVCTGFKDGWLFHTIQDFFKENLTDLLNEGELDGYTFCGLDHLESDIEKYVEHYMLSLRLTHETSYSNKSDFGFELAKSFLKFLPECFNDRVNAKTRSRHLYYKASSHLILWCPSDNFSQERFMQCLKRGLHNDRRERLKQIVMNCIQEEDCGEFINLECLWSHLKIMEDEFELRLV